MAEAIVGLNDFKSKLDQLPLTIRRTMLVGAVKKGGLLLLALAQYKVPVRTGFGASQLMMRTDESSPTSVTVDIGPSRKAFYLDFIERGAKPHAIAITKSGGWLPAGALVQHPGIKPTPFLRPALDEGQGEAQEIIRDDLAYQLDRIAL